MKLPIFRLRSLKTRVVLITLVVFVISIWLLASYISTNMREDLQGILGEQQVATVSLSAAEINSGFQERMDALQLVAKSLDSGLFDRPAAMQELLEQRPTFQVLFNAGIFVVRSDGTAIAEVPRISRAGINYMDRDHVAAALTLGNSTVGKPVVGSAVLGPTVAMSVPIRDDQGKVIGALAGAIDLSKPNFLDNVNESHYGKSGGYIVVDPRNRLFVTATNRDLVMAPLPAKGVNPVLDRRLQGFDGAAVNINSMGIEVLTSSGRIPSAGWFLIATLPTQEAFAPIETMKRNVMQSTILLTALAGGLVWWLLSNLLRRQFAPMMAACKSIEDVSATANTLQPLPIISRDEVGVLIGAFNRLLATLKKRQDELTGSVQHLRESEERYRTAFRASPDAVNINRLVDGLYIDVNQGFTRLTGWTREEVMGKTSQEINIWRNFADRQRLVQALQQEGICESLEADFLIKDGTVISAQMSAKVMMVDGVQCILSITRDITERKAAEEAQRIAATAFESQLGTFITDARKVILRVNKAFTAITGYTAEEAVGQTPALFSSGQHDAAFFAGMWNNINRTGAWQGEIWNRRKNGNVYPGCLSISSVKNDAGLLTHYVGAFSDISSFKAAEGQINDLSYIDLLTGLANRVMLIVRLQQAVMAAETQNCKGALLLIDLDQFKNVNDSLGYDQGDEVLKCIAKRLIAAVQLEGDTVARLGGDEFAVILDRLSPDPQEALRQAEMVTRKILEVIQQPCQLAKSTVLCTTSIGITFFGEQHEQTLEPLKRAELAMFQAKAAGGNTLRFFDPQMQAVVSARTTLEAALREAILKQQFTLHYQAQVSDSDGIIGVEALLRWVDPKRGIVSPAEFIPLAEETGLILPIGAWVLETACQQLSAWAGRPAMAHLSIAVNVSSRQFREINFVQQVLTTLARTGANAQRLKLELTESILVNDVLDVIVKMNALKASGIGFAIDDFGTGYSSLVYLKRLPLERLKIDQGFVRDILVEPDDASIARAIIAMATSMGLGVIAEGVETEAQREFLAGLGCHTYQGYLFSRPLPVAEFEALVQRR